MENRDILQLKNKGHLQPSSLLWAGKTMYNIVNINNISLTANFTIINRYLLTFYP